MKQWTGKTEGMVYPPDGWTIGNQLWIVPLCEEDDTLRQQWLKSVAPLPTADLVYKERMAFSDTHEKVDQDIIEPGGDTADMDAAMAEMGAGENEGTEGYVIWPDTIVVQPKCV